MHFADDVIARARRLGHPLCLGLDPHLDRMPPLFGGPFVDPGDAHAAPAVGDFLTAVLERAAERVAAVKPQVAFFERLGWPGMRVLAGLLERARALGVPVVMDAKRGDVGSTAAAYADAYLGPGAAFPAAAVTVNPYLGLDALEPFLAAARGHGKGLFVLVKTSNPGAADFQDLVLRPGDAGPALPLFAAVAAALRGAADALEGAATGWSSLGVVVGATYPADARRVRELLPRSLFLVPGYGAQGAGAADAVRGFVPGPAGREGGLVNASRALLFPPGATTADRRRWETAIDQALDRATDELAAAVAA